jgi:hypothetical protein
MFSVILDSPGSEGTNIFFAIKTFTSSQAGDKFRNMRGIDSIYPHIADKQAFSRLLDELGKILSQP